MRSALWLDAGSLFISLHKADRERRYYTIPEVKYNEILLPPDCENYEYLLRRSYLILFSPKRSASA